MKKSFVSLVVALAISLAVNAYLFNLVINWQEAWLQQIITTSDIELLYKKSGADITIDSIESLVSSELGNHEITTVSVSEGLLVNADKAIILSDGTKLYFNDGKYMGSKANLPEGLEHWGFVDEKF